jgi:hypothetical protein
MAHKEGMRLLTAVDHRDLHAGTEVTLPMHRDCVEEERHILRHAQVRPRHDGRDRGREDALQHARALDQRALEFGLSVRVDPRNTACLGLVATDHVDVGHVSKPIGLCVHEALKRYRLPAC